MNEIIDQIKPKMQKAIDSLAHEFNKIRTGRVNLSLFESILVECYDKSINLNQVKMKEKI